MPLLRFDILEGRDEAEIVRLLDAAHEAVVEALDAPARDRFQVVHQHRPYEMIIQDTGLEIERSDKVIMITITSVYRTDDIKQKLYKALVDKLVDRCGINPNDVMIAMVSNTVSDWSFGSGEAQFLNGKLARR